MNPSLDCWLDRECLLEVLVLLGLRQALEEHVHPDLLRGFAVVLFGGQQLRDGRVQVEVVGAVQKSEDGSDGITILSLKTFTRVN